MDSVKAYIITIIGCALISTIALAVSPEGDIKKHLKFLLGVVFTAVMLTPLANGALGGISIPQPYFGATEGAAVQESIKKVMNEQAMSLHKAKLEEKIAEAAAIKPEQVSVNLKDNGDIERVILKNAQPFNADKANARTGIPRGLFVIESN